MKGYTLIEVLVVIVISSIILSSSTFVLRNSINVTSELKKINSLSLNNIHFQSLLRNDLRHAINGKEGNKDSFILSNGNELSFLRLGLNDDDFSNVNLFKIKWEVQNKKITRYVYPIQSDNILSKIEFNHFKHKIIIRSIYDNKESLSFTQNTPLDLPSGISVYFGEDFEEIFTSRVGG